MNTQLKPFKIDYLGRVTPKRYPFGFDPKPSVFVFFPSRVFVGSQTKRRPLWAAFQELQVRVPQRYQASHAETWREVSGGALGVFFFFFGGGVFIIFKILLHGFWMVV